MKLLAIPNDPTNACMHVPESDFVDEINPIGPEGKRIFDEVRILNWRDREDSSIHGMPVNGFLEDKTAAEEVMDRIRARGDVTYPAFRSIFETERERISQLYGGFEPDVIRAFNTHSAAELGIMAKEELDAPLVVSAHDVTRLTPAVRRADSLVCISEVLSRKCIIEQGMDPEKIKKIPDGVNMGMFSPRKTLPENFNKYFNGSNPKVLSVSRIVPGKNIEGLLESVALLKEKFPETLHLHLGNGSGKYYQNVLKQAEDLGLKRTSLFIGPRPRAHLPYFYSWADLHVLPTLWEGLGRVAIESLACGTPVVTSDYAPMTEIVENEKNGLTANPRSSKEVADSMIRFFQDKGLREKLQGASRESVFSRFNGRNVMVDHARNYGSVVRNYSSQYSPTLV